MRWLGGVIGSVLLVIGPAGIALADGPTTKVVCDKSGMNCTTVVVNPGGVGGGGGAPRPPGAKDGDGTVKPVVDPLTKEEREALSAACRGVEVFDPAACRAAANPGGGGVSATPEMALTIAKAKLELDKPTMGTAPCTGQGCVGRVGVPVWLWTQEWQSKSVTATAGPHSITLTATPSKVVWSLGDGQSVTCTSAGTKYEKSMGWASSPDCGLSHGYKRMGHYTMTATMTWDVSWSGSLTGSETMTTSSSSPVRIGEIQVVVEG